MVFSQMQSTGPLKCICSHRLASDDWVTFLNPHESDQPHAAYLLYYYLFH